MVPALSWELQPLGHRSRSVSFQRCSPYYLTFRGPLHNEGPDSGLVWWLVRPDTKSRNTEWPTFLPPLHLLRTGGRTRTYDYCFVRAEPLPLDDARMFGTTHVHKVVMPRHLRRVLSPSQLNAFSWQPSCVVILYPAGWCINLTYSVSDLNRCSRGLKVLYPGPLD